MFYSLRGKSNFRLRPQNKILVPFRGFFQRMKIRRAPPSLLYRSPAPLECMVHVSEPENNNQINIPEFTGQNTLFQSSYIGRSEEKFIVDFTYLSFLIKTSATFSFPHSIATSKDVIFWLLQTVMSTPCDSISSTMST